MNFTNLRNIFATKDCTALYVKELAENDNSKNQIYFGPGFQSINIFPNQGILPDLKPTQSGFKAKLDFHWISDDGSSEQAPHAQLILYPQYPEVRFSGFLQGCRQAPSEVMKKRLAGRLLFLGTTPAGMVYGYAINPDHTIAREYRVLGPREEIGVFTFLGSPASTSLPDGRDQLIKELRKIHKKGWVDSKQLSQDGRITACNAPQCGGFTLEAELGIPKNSRSEPDIYGWEIKQHSVTNFERIETGVITLMTPEPTGGYYKDYGVEKFIRTFGYKDKLGRADRFNFGGIYRVGQRHSGTRLTLHLEGFDKTKGKITKADGAIVLITDRERVVASWDFANLMCHWTRKHTKAAYVPSMCKTEPIRQYAYGSRIRLAQDTDFLHFLQAMARGAVYYDPGLKLENASSSKPATKRRSQFRVASKDVSSLYEFLELITL